jgi:hypothetical protein
MFISGLGASVQNDFKVILPQGPVTVRSDIYGPLFNILGQRTLSLGDTHRLGGPANRPLTETMQVFATLVGGGLALPLLPEGASASARQAARTYNLSLAETIAQGGEAAQLAAPAFGAAIHASIVEVLVVLAILSGQTLALGALTRHVRLVMERLGRAVLNEGQAVADPADADRIIGATVQKIIDRRVRFFRMLDILD